MTCISREALLERVSEVKDKLELDLNKPFDDGVRIGFENVEIEIENFPAADVRRVVYCKDCIYSQPWYADKRICSLWNEDGGNSVFNDGFCNYGTKTDKEKPQKNKADYLERLAKMQTNYCPNCGAQMDMMEEQT